MPHGEAHGKVILQPVGLFYLKQWAGQTVQLCYSKFVKIGKTLSHSMKIDNSSLQRVEEFKYMGKT
jgi:hypothetical protein